MYKSVSISNFRGITHLEVNSLSRINLLVGPNNVGKTSILEAIFLLTGSNPDIVLRVNAIRGITIMRVELAPWGDMPWNSLFNNFNALNPIKLSGIDSNDNQIGVTIVEKAVNEYPLDLFASTSTSSDNLSRSKMKKLELSYTRNRESYLAEISFQQSDLKIDAPKLIPAVFPGHYLSAFGVNSIELNEKYGVLVQKGQDGKLLEILRIIEPDINGIYSVTIGGTPQLLIDVKGIAQRIPIQYLGGGINRLALFAIYLLTLESGIIFIDEIENGIYYRSLKNIWEKLGELSKLLNVQIFATTHSWECVTSAHEALAESQNDFSVYRVDAKPNITKAIRYDRNLLKTAIDQKIEVR